MIITKKKEDQNNPEVILPDSLNSPIPSQPTTETATQPIKVKIKKVMPKGTPPPIQPVLPVTETTTAITGKTKEDVPSEINFTDDELHGILAEEGLSEVKHKQHGEKSSREDIEYRRKQILRLLLRGVPRKTIMVYLEMPRATLDHEVREIYKSVKKDMVTLDYPLFVGMAVNFYDEARNIALRLATDTKEKSNLIKMRALEVALKAEGDKHKYLQIVGLYKATSPIEIGDTAKGESDAEDFLGLLKSVSNVQTVEGVYEEVGLSEAGS